MSIKNANVFISIYKKEKKLRDYLGSLQSVAKVRSFLKDLELEFTDEEFEEAYNILSVKCKDETEHNILTQVKRSYIMLITTSDQ